MPGYGQMHFCSTIPMDLAKLALIVLQERYAHSKIMFNTILIENQITQVLLIYGEPQSSSLSFRAY